MLYFFTIPTNQIKLWLITIKAPQLYGDDMEDYQDETFRKYDKVREAAKKSSSTSGPTTKAVSPSSLSGRNFLVFRF